MPRRSAGTGCTRPKAAGKGADLDAIRAVDPDLAEKESLLLGSALRQVMQALREAVTVGNERLFWPSPTPRPLRRRHR